MRPIPEIQDPDLQDREARPFIFFIVSLVMLGFVAWLGLRHTEYNRVLYLSWILSGIFFVGLAWLSFERYTSDVSRAIRNKLFVRKACRFLFILDPNDEPRSCRLWLREENGIGDRMWCLSCDWPDYDVSRFDEQEERGNVLFSSKTGKPLAIETLLGPLWVRRRTASQKKGVLIGAIHSLTAQPCQNVQLSQDEQTALTERMEVGEKLLWVGKSSSLILFPEIEFRVLYVVTNRRAIIAKPGADPGLTSYPAASLRYCEIREGRNGIGDIVFPTVYSKANGFWKVPQLDLVAELLSHVANDKGTESATGP